MTSSLWTSWGSFFTRIWSIYLAWVTDRPVHGRRAHCPKQILAQVCATRVPSTNWMVARLSPVVLLRDLLALEQNRRNDEYFRGLLDLWNLSDTAGSSADNRECYIGQTGVHLLIRRDMARFKQGIKIAFLATNMGQGCPRCPILLLGRADQHPHAALTYGHVSPPVSQLCTTTCGLNPITVKTSYITSPFSRDLAGYLRLRLVSARWLPISLPRRLRLMPGGECPGAINDCGVCQLIGSTRAAPNWGR
ncbi:hypothetical protein C8R47DRAFT_157320 [Mycena vitilis]|nr:hypothetical protein C8R47DRAFT_157320 [Mycena vitilis]